MVYTKLVLLCWSCCYFVNSFIFTLDESERQRRQKRPRSDEDPESNNEEEPLIKKSAFKLQPATLIHKHKKPSVAAAADIKPSSTTTTGIVGSCVGESFTIMQMSLMMKSFSFYCGWPKYQEFKSNPIQIPF